MFDEEMLKRKQFSYPPFSRLILLTFKHKMKEIVESGAYQSQALRFSDAPAREARR